MVQEWLKVTAAPEVERASSVDAGDVGRGDVFSGEWNHLRRDTSDEGLKHL